MVVYPTACESLKLIAGTSSF